MKWNEFKKKYIPKDKIEFVENIINKYPNLKNFYMAESFNPVTKPVHYTSGKYECIDVMIDTFGVVPVKNFCILNAFKYIYRYKLKNGNEDISKAIWYLNKYLELCEN